MLEPVERKGLFLQGSVVGSKEKCSSKFEEAKSDMNFCMSLSVLNNTQSKFTRLLSVPVVGVLVEI